MSLWHALLESARPSRGAFHGIDGSIALEALAGASSLGDRLGDLRGRSVLLAVRDPLLAAVLLVELDGLARRLVLATPDLSLDLLRRIGAAGEIDAVVRDETVPAGALAVPDEWLASPRLAPCIRSPAASVETEWVLLTSGTSGEPKLVLHSLASLAGTLPGPTPADDRVWSTFYDIRRYGGLQIFLRAVLAGCPLVIPGRSEPVEEFLRRADAAAVTHISGTPSHWRRALMSGATRRFFPRYVRLSGEIADQAILDSLRAAYPEAVIVHAFASTEAGLAFEVADGRAGFPSGLVGAPGAVDLRVDEGTLRIRSARTARRYLGPGAAAIPGDDGFVDTGDLVELREGRYHFLGRRGGVINVGGLKVHPEEVESVINADPRVHLSRVRARRNAITGAVVVADVVLKPIPGTPLPTAAADLLRRELLEACRSRLAAHKVPASMRIVDSLELSAAGKLVRPGD